MISSISLDEKAERAARGIHRNSTQYNECGVVYVEGNSPGTNPNKLKLGWMEKAKKAIAINVKIDFHHRPYYRKFYCVGRKVQGGERRMRWIFYVHFVIMGH